MNQDFINRVIELTNIERQKVGLAPLSYNSLLTNAAQNHSQNMALQDFFAHVGQDGSHSWERVTAMGYEYANVGENIYRGVATPEQVVSGWMNSTGHRDNILSALVQGSTAI